MVNLGETEYWLIELPAGKVLRGEKHSDAINRELTELVRRGWRVHSFQRSNTLGPANFLMVKES